MEALFQGIRSINPALLAQKRTFVSTVFLRVGPGTLESKDFSLATTASGWSGFVGQLPMEVLGEDGNPIGAYIAAALCAGEVFKFVRSMREDVGSFAKALWLDAYRL